MFINIGHLSSLPLARGGKNVSIFFSKNLFNIPTQQRIAIESCCRYCNATTPIHKLRFEDQRRSTICLFALLLAMDGYCAEKGKCRSNPRAFSFHLHLVCTYHTAFLSEHANLYLKQNEANKERIDLRWNFTELDEFMYGRRKQKMERCRGQKLCEHE